MSLRLRDLVPGTRGLPPRSDRSDSRRTLIGAIICSVVLLAASCGKGVEKVMTLTFSKDQPDLVTISTSTELGEAAKGSAEAAVIDREREALLNNSDEWSLRFANAEPEWERITVERQKRQLRRVERSGGVATSNLQRFFFDTPLTVSVIRGEGWNELTILAGTPNRATRQQKNHVDELLSNFSEHAVHYIHATRALYTYLDNNDARSEAVFYSIAAALATEGQKKDDTPPPELSDAEEKLVTAVADSINALLDDNKGGAGNVDREFDAAFNPFPAEFHVVVPGEPLELEGFSKNKEGGLQVKTTSVLDAIGLLEGKWLSPDPVAGLLRIEDSAQIKPLFAAAMARQPRHTASTVRAEDVRDALVTMMKPAERYRVRWLVTAPRKRPSS